MRHIMKRKPKPPRSWREHELLMEATQKALSLCGGLGYEHPDYNKIQKACDEEAMQKLAQEQAK